MVFFFSGAQETGDPVWWASMLVGEKHDGYMVVDGDWEKNITDLALGVGRGATGQQRGI